MKVRNKNKISYKKRLSFEYIYMYTQNRTMDINLMKLGFL